MNFIRRRKMCESAFLKKMLVLVPSSIVFVLGVTKSDLVCTLLGLSLFAILYDQMTSDNSVELREKLAELDEKINKLDEKITNSCWY